MPPSPAASIAQPGASGTDDTGDTGEADIMFSTVSSVQYRWCSLVL
jgi:hypothetical protein